MEDLLDPDHHEDRMVRAAERLRFARERASQAHEHLILARERLAQARKALCESQAQEAPRRETGADPAKPLGDTP
jgi:hypothetical protein